MGGSERTEPVSRKGATPTGSNNEAQGRAAHPGSGGLGDESNAENVPHDVTRLGHVAGTRGWGTWLGHVAGPPAICNHQSEITNHKSKMPSRREAREAALQILYQDDVNSHVNPAVADAMLETRLKEPELLEFARELVAGVRRNRAELDASLTKIAENWSVDRMAATDRNVLRLAGYEILHTETPVRVAINEAVELAKRFGTAQSGSFVNGILDRLMREREGVDSG